MRNAGLSDERREFAPHDLAPHSAFIPPLTSHSALLHILASGHSSHRLTRAVQTSAPSSISA